MSNHENEQQYDHEKDYVEEEDDDALLEKEAEQFRQQQQQEQAAADNQQALDQDDSEEESPIEKELRQTKEQLMRAEAELDNVQRRAKKQVADARKFANEKILNDLLEVLDSLERALENEQEQELEGVRLTLKKFTEVLEKHGVETINPEGDKFDPKLHEAMTTQPSEEAEPNTVLQVLQKGYSLNGRLVRPARVIVSQST